MLQISPDAKVKQKPFDADDDALYCAACGALVTRGRWRCHMDGSHQHRFSNPAGVVFDLVCFREAPGTLTVGEPTFEATWFSGYQWDYALCAGCQAHLGWRFAGAHEPPVFFGLIQPKLTATPKPQGTTR